MGDSNREQCIPSPSGLHLKNLKGTQLCQL
jgi:hypothetical protein